MARMNEQTKALHALLSARWADRVLWTAGIFKPKDAFTIDINSICALLELLGHDLDAGDWTAADEIVSFIPLHADLLANPRYDGHGAHLDHMLGAIIKRDARRAKFHRARLTKIVRCVAADQRFEDGDNVYVMRTRHGWYDGSVRGRLRKNAGGLTVEGDDGDSYEIEHVRDIRHV